MKIEVTLTPKLEAAPIVALQTNLLDVDPNPWNLHFDLLEGEIKGTLYIRTDLSVPIDYVQKYLTLNIFKLDEHNRIIYNPVILFHIRRIDILTSISNSENIDEATLDETAHESKYQLSLSPIDDSYEEILKALNRYLVDGRRNEELVGEIYQQISKLGNSDLNRLLRTILLFHLGRYSEVNSIIGVKAERPSDSVVGIDTFLNNSFHLGITTTKPVTPHTAPHKILLIASSRYSDHDDQLNLASDDMTRIQRKNTSFSYKNTDDEQFNDIESVLQFIDKKEPLYDHLVFLGHGNESEGFEIDIRSKSHRIAPEHIARLIAKLRNRSTNSLIFLCCYGDRYLKHDSLAIIRNKIQYNSNFIYCTATSTSLWYTYFIQKFYSRYDETLDIGSALEYGNIEMKNLAQEATPFCDFKFKPV